MLTQKVATKSLSALKSRKEEIIDSLEDIVGKEATKKISNRTEERAASTVHSSDSQKKFDKAKAAHQKTVNQVHVNQQNVQNTNGTSCLSGQDYSLWTSKAFTPFVDEDEALPGI